MWHLYPQPLVVKIKLGAEFKRRGETLTWRVSAFDDDTVELNGPGACRGRMIVPRAEFDKDWVKA